MFRFIGLCLGTLVRLVRARRSFLLENLALRQQLAVLKRRRQTSKEIQELIFRMVVENSTWGAPRIHGELLMLGFDISPANDLSLDETGA
jgi:hypothetical protein